ncbi:insulinase family protein [Thermodesulfobacteriota bacterium]
MKLKEGDTICGFEVERIVPLELIGAAFVQMRHSPLGTRYAHISTGDSENTFAVAFKTVPADSTGVAHILEHTALCGSRRFPVRDPFFSMLRRSMSSFMNAFTAPDWTMYPFSTQNRRDFFNLLGVYVDAAFFPLLSELSFRQEGHRLEFGQVSHEDGAQGARLMHKGVVYNEMKGAMSSPRELMVHGMMETLYPTTTYGHNSGGDPARIPSLTHEALCLFHRRHYHPSNAFFYSYGNLPVEEVIGFLHEKVLSHFTPIDPHTDVPPEPRWADPTRVRRPYPIAEGVDMGKKSQVAVAWVMTGVENAPELLALTLLERILLGNAASPLRKALIDTGRGSALADGTGYEPSFRDTMFSCGLKGTDESDAPAIEAVVFEVLAKLANNGIHRDLISAALHQLEFQRREITNYPYPFGLNILLSFCGGWLHHADPVRFLRFGEDLDRIRASVEKEPFFERHIERWFLDNPHRALFILYPDTEWLTNENARVEKELEALKTRLTPSQQSTIIQEAQQLQALQEKKEDVSCLPTLEIRDIPASVRTTESPETDRTASASGYVQPTNGISYVTMAARVGSLPEALVPLVPLFCFAFTKMGTLYRDYASLAHNIEAHTGGITLQATVHTENSPGEPCLPLVSLDAKCLSRNLEPMFALLEELLTGYAFTDLKRLKDLLLQSKAAFEARIVQEGHRLALLRASRGFSRPRALREAWIGIEQFQTLKRLASDMSEESVARLAESFKKIAQHIFRRGAIDSAVIGEQASVRRGFELHSSIFFRLPESVVSGSSEIGGHADTRGPALREGWSTSTAVSFVAGAVKTVRFEHPDAPVLSVMSKLLRSLYLHRELREKGGAYGGFAMSDAEDGIFALASYRDPHVVRTMRTFMDTLGFARSGEYTEHDVEEAILQTCSEIDKPDSPAADARKAFYRALLGLSDRARQLFKERVLAVTRKKLMETADRYFSDVASLALAVVSDESTLREANTRLTQAPLKIQSL